MTKKNYTFKEKLRYRFDNSLSKGTVALIAYLGVFSLIIVILAATIVSIFKIGEVGESPMSFMEAAWQSLMRTFDSGAVGADTSWSARVLFLVVTIGGIFIFSSLIGVLTSGLSSRLDELRKGRSTVLESNHTLILGWSSKIFPILNELITANENEKNAHIVILSSKDKVEMEDEIRQTISDTKTTKIICRSGFPYEVKNLDIVNFNDANSIIILSPEIDNPDIHVIKTILAITHNQKRKAEQYHIVAEIQSKDNLEAAQLVGKNEAVFVQSAELIARLTAQTCRQSGLSIIYTELLDFGGDEIYFKRESSIDGKTYKDSLVIYDKSAVIGFMKNDGSVVMNPPMETIIETGSSLIVVAEDDSKILLNNRKEIKINESAILQKKIISPEIERNLILGWNEKAPIIIKELDNYVVKGSEITIVCDDENIEETISSIQDTVKNQTINLIIGDTTRRSTLEALHIFSFQDIIILGKSGIEIQEADAKTLITLLHLRNFSEAEGKPLKIVSEMFDIENRNLAEITKADDFIISDRMTSLMISQLSENKNLKKVFDDLFQSEGSEIYLKTVNDYVKTDVEVDFFTIIESAAQKGETAIGYRLLRHQHNSKKAYGVVLNPLKSDKITFKPEDKIIVLALD